MTSSIMIEIALTGLWQSALIALSAFIAIRLLRLESAATRSLLWSAAFFAAAFAPLAAFAPSPMPSMAPAIDAAPMQATMATASPVMEYSGSRRVVTLGDVAVPGLIFIWLFGTGYFSIRILKDYASMGKIRRDSTPFSMPLARQSSSFTDLRSHNAINSPMTTGIFKPVIILPESMVNNAPTSVIQNAVAHERAHIERGDLIANLAENMILCVFWWNPILRNMRQRIAGDREMACDDRAARMATDPGAYAAALVDCAERMSKLKQENDNQTALAVLGKRSELAHRVERLLSNDYALHSKTPWSRIILATAAITTMTICVASAAPRIEFPARGQNTVNHGPGQDLVLAILDEDQSEAAALLAGGADINAVLEGDGTPLIAAVNNGDEGLAQWLIVMGANVDAYARYDETALISAVRNNDDSMVRLLIDAGANVNLSATTERNEVRSPLGEARKLRQSAIENMLINAGAQN